MYRLIEDVALLTQINPKILNKIVDASQEAILFKFKDMEEGSTEIIDIGFGTINVQKTYDELVFNFVPSSYIQEHIYDVKSTLEQRVEDKLTKKILSTYKELI